MSNIVSRQIHLKNRIIGMPEEDDFEVVEVPLPAPEKGEVLVQNLYTSVDPYMRGGMRSAQPSQPSKADVPGGLCNQTAIGLKLGIM